MTETTLKILLSELTTVRIRCRKGTCRGVVEVPTDDLVKLTRNSATCPICSEALVTTRDAHLDQLPSLGRAIKAVLALKDECVLEFSVPMAPTAPGTGDSS